jgi:hypothetical protein
VQQRESKGYDESQPVRNKNKSVMRTFSKPSVEQLSNVPLKSAKSSRSLRRAAYVSEANPVTEEDRERNEASEPKDHGEAFHTGDDACVVELCFGEAHRYHDQVGQSN